MWSMLPLFLGIASPTSRTWMTGAPSRYSQIPPAVERRAESFLETEGVDIEPAARVEVAGPDVDVVEGSDVRELSCARVECHERILG